MSDASSMTKSLRVALEDLKLEPARIVYPREKRYPVHDHVEALPLGMIGDGLGGLGGNPPD